MSILFVPIRISEPSIRPLTTAFYFTNEGRNSKETNEEGEVSRNWELRITLCLWDPDQPAPGVGTHCPPSPAQPGVLLTWAAPACEPLPAHPAGLLSAVATAIPIHKGKCFSIPEEFCT